MKKFLLFIAITMIGVVASAADQTKEQYLAAKKASAEKAGKTFDEAKTIKEFDKKDVDKDGVFSNEEQAAEKAAAKAAAEAKKNQKKAK
jgi:hypothetical protein